MIDYGTPRMTFLFYFQPFLVDGYFITQNERSIKNYEKDIKAIMYGLPSLYNRSYCITDNGCSCVGNTVLDGVC